MQHYKNIRRMIAGVAMRHKIEYSDDKVNEEIIIFGEPEKVKKKLRNILRMHME